MSKVFSAKEAAIAVLKKTEELLKKSEVLAKYEPENHKSLKHPEISGRSAKDASSADKSFKVVKQNDKAPDARLGKTPMPGANPKEEAEGNNKPDGMEPRYEFKDKVKKEISKENKEFEKSEMKKKYEGFKAVEASAAKSGASDPAAVAAAAGRKKYGKKAFQEAAAKGKKMGKSEELSHEEIARRLEKTGLTPEQIRAHLDKAADYPQELASKNIEQNMKHKSQWPGGEKQAVAVGINEAKAGKHVKPEHKSEDIRDEDGFAPIKHGVSAKLAKFMEWKHHKNKHNSNVRDVKEVAPIDKMDDSMPPMVMSEKKAK